jgi:hypothetical protein
METSVVSLNISPFFYVENSLQNVIDFIFTSASSFKDYLFTWLPEGCTESLED